MKTLVEISVYKNDVNEALKVLNNHMLCLSGKMVSKPKTKDVIQALKIIINEINKKE